MSLFSKFKDAQSKPEGNKSALLAPSAASEVAMKGPTLHPDLAGLIWIADGPHANYSSRPAKKTTITLDELRLTLSFPGLEEPSLIYTKLPISKPADSAKVDRPPYFPRYSTLTPEQKWVYLELLANPYDSSINIGYVFILYYGLERHLLMGDYETAFRTILKLRDSHSNSSFQSYSASALVLSAMLHKRGDLAIEFIDSLDKEYEFKFSDNLLLICYYSFDYPIRATDIARMAKSFEFKNMNYIKGYPDIFIDALTSVLLKKYGTDGVLLKNFIDPSEIANLKVTSERLFANESLLNEEIPVPQLLTSRQLQSEIRTLLESAHNQVKLLLAQRKKTGKPLPNRKQTKKKPELTFDKALEASLLKDLNKNSDDLVNRHFIYIYLQDFYYKYRSLDRSN